MKLLNRPRRLRTSPAIRNLVAESKLTTNDLIWPLFIHNEKDKQEVAAMEGVYRLDENSLFQSCEDALNARISAIAIFPTVDPKLCTPDGKEAYNDDGIVQSMLRKVKTKFPELLVIVDVALDPYTSHGHDGVLNDKGEIANDETVLTLIRQALSLANAGADILAPSDMMDGRILAIRNALEDEKLVNVKILSYAAKYASCFYGPFREAIGSGNRLMGDKKTYQMDYANIKEALREIQLDVVEGADMVMVKPGMPYLDVIREINREINVPLFAYQVSGEYAMISTAANINYFNKDAAILESLYSFKRAGCSGILTYFALTAAKLLNQD